MKKEEVIGEFIVPEDFEHTKRDYECAAWSETILVMKGSYPLYGIVTDNQVDDFPGVWTIFNGVVVKDYFQSLYCGMRVGEPYNIFKNAGQQSMHRVSTYAHALAIDILKGFSNGRNLIGFKAIEFPFQYEDRGQTVNSKTYKIVRI